MVTSPSEKTPLVGSDDAVQLHELNQRWFMRTRLNSWTAFCLACLVQCICNGVCLGFQEIMQYVADPQSVYSLSELDVVYNWGYGLAICGVLPGGMIFDRYGPLAIAIGSTLVASLGYIGMWLGLHYSLLGHVTWLFPTSMLVTFIAADINGTGVLAYLWILHDESFALICVYNASFAFSYIFAYLASYLYTSYGVGIADYMLGVGVLAFVTAWSFLFLLPTRSEALLLKKISENRQSSSVSSQDERAPKDDNIFEVEEAHGFEREYSMLCNAVIIAFWQYARDTWVFMLNVISVNMAFMTLGLNQFEFYLTMFGSNAASHLESLFLILFSSVGPIVLVCTGILFDIVGVVYSVLLGNCAAVIFVVVSVMPYVSSQIIAILLFTVGSRYYRIVVLKFAQLYAPPELFGTLQGLLLLVVGLSEVALCEIDSLLADAIFTSSYSAYISQFVFWCIFSVLTALFFGWWVNYKQPMKAVPDETLEKLHNFLAEQGLS